MVITRESCHATAVGRQDSVRKSSTKRSIRLFGWPIICSDLILIFYVVILTCWQTSRLIGWLVCWIFYCHCQVVVRIFTLRVGIMLFIVGCGLPSFYYSMILSGLSDLKTSKKRFFELLRIVFFYCVSSNYFYQGE